MMKCVTAAVVVKDGCVSEENLEWRNTDFVKL